MSILNNKFDVLRGWTPGGDAGIDQSLPVQNALTISPGMIVALQSTGVVALPAAPSSAWQPLYVVVEGNTANEFDTNFVGKALVLRGKLTIKTDVLLASGLTVGSPVTCNAAGQIITAGANYRIGFVLENTISVDGCVTVELDI
jgi:hypothetical protein